VATQSSTRTENRISLATEKSLAVVPETPEREDVRTPHQRTNRSMPPYRATIRRTQLRQIVPVADTTIYEMEQRGEFPRRFNLTPRCVVWDLAEVEAWIQERRLASEAAATKRAPPPGRTATQNTPRQIVASGETNCIDGG
jgi:prophage regulatory protein